MLLNAVDRLYGVSQIVGKSFGFLDRRAAGVSERATDGGVLVTFAESPGWSRFDLQLPHDSRLVQAGTGIMTRYGIWRFAATERSLDMVDGALRDLGATSIDQGASRCCWSIRKPLGERIEVKLAREDGTATLAVRQMRTRHGVSQSVRDAVGS